MRIAVWHNLPSGGGKRALYDHVRGLVGRGHHVEAWCPASADPKFLPLGDLCPEYVLPWDDRPPRLRVLGGYRQAAVATHALLAALDRHCQQAAAAIDAGGFDVLFANTCWVTASPPIGRYVELPSALYLQEPQRGLHEATSMGQPPFAAVGPPGQSRLAPWYLRQAARDWFEIPVRRRLVRDEWLAARSYDRILVNSHFSRESVLRAYGLDAEVCYLGIDPAAFAPRPDAPRDYLIGVGSFTFNKNIGFAIRAVGCLPEPRPPLVWVGNSADDKLLAELQDEARKLGVDFQPRHLVPQAELTALLGGALAMVYTSRLEPFGYAPLEANACGTPVVTVAEGGMRETVRDGVNGLVAAAKPAAVAAAVRRLQVEPGLAERLGRAGRALVEADWSLEAATDRLEAALKEVATGPVRMGR